MNRASRYLANVSVLRSFRVAVVTLIVCICHHVTLTDSKLFERCELAQLLRYGHGVDVNDVANWVCIAQHSSSLNTAAFGGNAKSGSHGLFQISDEYWCSPPGKGVGCGVSCDRLRDDDISDDLKCVQQIHDEHQRLSGDGYNAWNAYELYCKDNPYEYIDGCFGNEEQEYIRSKSITTNYIGDEEEESYDPSSRGKVYGRCELAKELFLKHKMPMDEIPTWVCIAQHESNYDTSAVGRLNADGSADHGLFQISDLFWCSHKGGHRKACGVPCSKFLDSDITDDVKCVKQIHKEHSRISGDGFNAWTVYKHHCHGTTEKYIRGCFDGIDVDESKPLEQYKTYAKPTKGHTEKPHGKVYEPCELADDLRNKYHLPEDQIATWVCIAKHESGYNTSAIGYGDHGLFQISDIYWCSPPGKGWACGLSCSDLEDSDISDDVACIRKIFDEHAHLSGDGFNAWTVYPRHCSNGRSAKYISHCSSTSTELLRTAASYNSPYSRPISSNSIEDYHHPSAKGKIYERCELANELLTKYHMPFEEIPTWVCIAHHESNFDTSAVGRLNADGSADHGLFQISDLFWCSAEEDGYGKACGRSCSKFLDSDISDDVDCIKQIHDEHTRISGDGFNAWAVYNAYCKDRTEQYTRGCFDGSASIQVFQPTQRNFGFNYVPKNKPRGKVYDDCELANELRDKHRIPKEQISSWVCIAKHQSGLNTAASVAGSHGMFFISEEFWCSLQGNGKACELQCSDLEDSDITDDVQCVRKIYDEHQRLFGNGFNAWIVYDQHCSNGRADDYINKCRGFESITTNALIYGTEENNYKYGGRALDFNKPVYNHAFNANPFLKHFDSVNNNAAVNSYQNPFLQQFQAVSPYQDIQGESFSESVNHEYVKNPFLKFIPSAAQKPTVSSIKTTTPLPIWRTTFAPTSTLSYGFFKQPTTTAPTKSVKSYVWSTPPSTNSLKSYMSEEKAKNEFFKTYTTPPPPAFTVTPRINRLQPYNLNTIQTFETTNSPFWLTTTTPKPTTRFQFYETSSQKSIAATPFWLTSTTPKPTSRLQFYESSTQKSVAATSFWLTSTTPKPTTRLQFSQSSTQKTVAATPFWLASTTPKPTSNYNSTFKQPTTPFWLAVTTPKPTNRFSQPNGTVPFWLASSTMPLTTSLFQSYQTNRFNSFKTTIKPSRPSVSTNKIPGTVPTIKSSSTSTTKKSTPSLSSRNSGQYNSGRYDSGKYNSGKYEPAKTTLRPAARTTGSSLTKPSTTTTTKSPSSRLSSAKFDPFKSLTTQSSTTISPWSRAVTSTTSKSTKYDPFRPFPPTTLRPKSTPITKNSYQAKTPNSGFYVPYTPKSPTTSKPSLLSTRITTTKPTTRNIWNTSKLPQTTRPIVSYTPTKSSSLENSSLTKSIYTARTNISSPFAQTTKWTSSKPFSFTTLKASSTTTTKPTQKFSFQFPSSSSRTVLNLTTPRPNVATRKSQIQMSTTSIPPWAITTTQVPITTVKSKTSSDSSKNNLYDLYFKLYGVQPPSGTRTT